MTAEAQRVVAVSLRKIVAWQKKHSDLHRSLLLASVLLKAHSACSASALAVLSDDDHHMSSSSSSSSSPTTTTTDNVERDEDDDVIVTLDDASIVASCPRNPEVRDFDQDQEESWDAIPDQALDEWTLSTTYSERIDTERNATTMKTDSEIAKDKRRDRGGDNTSAHSSLSTRKHRLEKNDAEEGEVASKRQRRADCETLCLDFDDLITSMEDEFGISAIDHLESSKSFDDSSLESFELGDSCENYFETLDCSADFLPSS